MLSGTTVTWSHPSLLEYDRKGFIPGLTLTAILGFFFTLLQAYEYYHATFTYSGHIYGAYMWFRDVVLEAEHQGHHTPVVQIHHRYGMTLFIASEVMFFVAWFWAYFDISLFPNEFVGNVWPPKDIETFDPWDIPLINTLVLLLSGTTVTWAHHSLI